MVKMNAIIEDAKSIGVDIPIEHIEALTKLGYIDVTKVEKRVRNIEMKKCYEEMKKTGTLSNNNILDELAYKYDVSCAMVVKVVYSR